MWIIVCSYVGLTLHMNIIVLVLYCCHKVALRRIDLKDAKGVLALAHVATQVVGVVDVYTLEVNFLSQNV